MSAPSLTAEERVRGVFRVLETGDAELAREVAAPTFSNREAASGPPACATLGPGGLLASSAWLRSAFPDLHFEILDVGVTRSQAWVRLKMQGTQTGPFVQYANGRPAQVLPPTGRRVDFEQIHLLTVSDDGVTRHEAVRDDLTMLGQLGVFPPSPKTALSIIGSSIFGARRAAIQDIIHKTEQASR